MRKSNLSSATAIDALGASWAVSPSSAPPYPHQMRLLAQAEDRLERLRDAPIHCQKKLLTVGVAVLSLFDLVALPDRRPCVKIRTLLKTVLGMSLASPEILTLGIIPNPVDPEIQCMLTGLRLWYTIVVRGQDL